jgi:hypothetical protein
MLLASGTHIHYRCVAKPKTALTNQVINPVIEVFCFACILHLQNYLVTMVQIELLVYNELRVPYSSCILKE